MSLTQAGIDASRYLTISIDAILAEMAERGLIPHVDGLSPLEAADLVHAEAQFLAKRLGLRALADGRNVIWDISFASQHAVESWIAAHRRAGYTIHAIFTELSIEESVRRSAAMHRRGHDEYRQGRGYGGRFIPAEAIRALADDPASCPVQDIVPCLPEAADSGRDLVVPGEVTTMIRAYLAGEMTLDALAGGSGPGAGPPCRRSPRLVWRRPPRLSMTPNPTSRDPSMTWCEPMTVDGSPILTTRPSP